MEHDGDVSIDCGEYDHCPICGEDWSKNPKGHKCSKMKLVDGNKPRFEVGCIDNYNEKFLKEIIKWQDMKIRVLINPELISADEVGLKSF